MMCIIVGTLGRCLPHLANVSPFTNLSLFASRNLNRAVACATILCAMLVSDLVLFFSFGYQSFFMYSLFTYSGFLAMALFGKKLSFVSSAQIVGARPWALVLKGGTLLVWVWLFTCGYWLWTNLGVWLVSGLYSRTPHGLLACYFAALPFLRNAFMGDAIWALIIFGCSAMIKKTNLVRCKV